MVEDFAKYFIIPSNLIVLSFAVGTLLFFFKKSRRISGYLFITAAAIYIIFACGPISFLLLGKLEYQYPYLGSTKSVDDIAYIVILSGHAEADHLIPLSSRVNDASAYRLIEALRINHEMPGATIVITGCNTVPVIMKELLSEMGVSVDKIIVENNSGSTLESAENVRELVGDRPFILITSAGHMPRSMLAFRKLGMDPVPAPTHYLTRQNNLAVSYLPSPLHLRYSDLAINEYAGILWYRLSGRI